MDQLTAMKVFVRVVETGSFSRTSERMSIPKATVTVMIQALEKHLQTKLLSRTTRRVMVTTDGALYYERAVRIIADINELDLSLSDALAAPSGRMRVEMAAAFSDSIVIPELKHFHARYPDIKIDLSIGDRTVDYLEEKVDCALRTGTPNDQSLIIRHVADMKFVTCASPDYIAAYGQPKRPEELEDTHQIVGFFRAQTNQNFQFQLRRREEYVEVNPNYAISVSDSRSYLAAGLNGLGVIQAPEYMARDAIKKRKLIPMLKDWQRDPMPLYLVYPPSKHISNKVRIFADWLIKLFANRDEND
jgi:LysR family transcriptional regulator, regulator for bpeEF and oprC